ncbi:hypothetical protein CCZ04_01795 [Escherichia coli]|nr:hypothetical protein CQA10_00135 [Escherichia coli]RBL36767.1 hypothetical protein CCZ04_01795 [Escherichia coli]
MVRESVFLSQVIPFTEQKKKEYLLYENHHSGLISFASPERSILIGVILWKVKTSSILMLFLLIIHHLIPQCS